jgi:mono/diheme cytochrome c family protein
MQWSRLFAAALVLGLTTSALNAQAQRQYRRGAGDKGLIEQGRYLVRIAGCNDCHTPGYAGAAGKVDEAIWLTGDALGWRGPWGTTYAPNLRLYFQKLSEAEWLKTARTFEPRPPMPWFNVATMTDRDLRAIYRYVRSLAPLGEQAPAYVPPGQEPKGPFIKFPG